MTLRLKIILVLLLSLSNISQVEAKLEFDNFIESIKKNHPKIKLARLDMEIASGVRLETQGAFDPSIDSSNFYYRYNSSSKLGEELDAFSSNTALVLPSRFGAKFKAGAKYAVGDISTPISPTGDGGEYFLTAEIPLLRNGFYRNKEAIAEKKAKLSETNAEFNYFKTSLFVLIDAAAAYYDWVAAKEIFDLENGMLSIVLNQANFTKEQSNLGNLPEIANSEALRELRMREGLVQGQSRKFQESSFKLNTFMWQNDGNASQVAWFDDVPSKILTQIKELKREDINSAQYNAIQNRPELKFLDISKEITKYDISFAKNQMLPLLNAYISPGYETGANGIGPSLELGVNISLPLRIRSAKGKLKQAENLIKQIDIQEKQILQKIFLEIENAASEVNANYKKYLAGQEELKYAFELEKGEYDRFELGDSTLFLVIRRQRARLESQKKLVEIVRDYRTALYSFELLQAVFLK